MLVPALWNNFVTPPAKESTKGSSGMFFAPPANELFTNSLGGTISVVLILLQLMSLSSFKFFVSFISTLSLFLCLYCCCLRCGGSEGEMSVEIFLCFDGLVRLIKGESDDDDILLLLLFLLRPNLSMELVVSRTRGLRIAWHVVTKQFDGPPPHNPPPCSWYKRAWFEEDKYDEDDKSSS